MYNVCKNLSMRTQGSARFTEYFKIQWFDQISFAWKDVQKSYQSADDARANFPKGKECRVMAITENGRFPLQ